MAPTVALALAGIGKSFPGVRALDDVSLEVRAGEVHAVVGENGAGKSTLMAVASGALVPDAGTVGIGGVAVQGDPAAARAAGLAIVRQEPALMPDLTVAENLWLGVAPARRPGLARLHAWAAERLAAWSPAVPVRPGDRVNSLTPDRRFIVEIVKALASEPRVLILDEPTEHLGAEDAARLFARIREITARGGAVVYISHRLREVRGIADRITVLRDGRARGTFEAGDLSEEALIGLIVGRAVDRTFPPKPGPDAGAAPRLRLRDLSGAGFAGVSLELAGGRILGLAGIEGQGQRDLLRALAGLAPSRGTIEIDGRPVRGRGAPAMRRAGVAFVPADRHAEGIFAELSVAENFALRSLGQDSTLGLLRPARAAARAREALGRFAVRAPGPGAPAATLSGGNQQKLVLAGAVAAGPAVLLIDEPTQGVDVGARAEIYRILRGIAADGAAIVLVSSDAAEIAGLCDRVLVVSRGRVVEDLAGPDLDEAAVTAAALRSTGLRDPRTDRIGRFWRWAAGDAAPLVMLAGAILVLGAAAAAQNPFYLTPRNLGGMAVLIATLALVAYGQQLLMLTGGIDLSVGPLMGLVQVVASFFFLAGAGAADWALGGLGMIGVAVAVGLANWALVEPLRLHPMVATLATFMAVQAVSLLLRPVSDGMIDMEILDLIGTRIGPLPVTLLLAAALAVALELLLYRHGLGLALRGVGSNEAAARAAGLRPRRLRLLAHVGCALFALLAAVTMIEQVGIGDPRAGIGYTIASIAAVVIGGGSLFGARGSFLGALLGAVFLIQVNTVTNFLGLSTAWQSYLLGAMIILAVALYSRSRRMAAVA